MIAWFVGTSLTPGWNVVGPLGPARFVGTVESRKTIRICMDKDVYLRQPSDTRQSLDLGRCLAGEVLSMVSANHNAHECEDHEHHAEEHAA